MPLTPGSRLGPYEVTALLGEGGMGQVYRATDSNLKRSVAIKVLPAAVAGDADRLARFQREAEVLAALNHPNIAAIYGLEKTPEFTALVMELVEGDDLSQRIAKSAIPLDQALPIAKQIAEALEAAHEQGIIHRDLKPANIKVRADGTVKVLDFGLAKAMEPAAGASPSMSMSPTITTPAMTQAGMILGTAAYMSPEQARGRTVDKRADIWAFGAVLYEMLTGTRAFGGDGIAETLANVINEEPTWEALPAAVPTHVRQTLRLCLRKPLRERVPDIGAVRLALEGAFETAASQSTETTTASSRGRLPWMAGLVVAAAVIVVLAVPAARHLRETPTPAPPETRVDIVTPDTDSPTSFALSPDGRQIAFVASGGGTSRLWLRSLTSATAQPLPGTEGAAYPFWSPDSRAVGFFAGSALQRIDLDAGVPRTVCSAESGRGGSWNADGVILFALSTASSLFSVPASGGVPVAATTLDRQRSHRFPSFLPDGRHFLFYALGTLDTAGIYLGTLDAPNTHRLTRADAAGVYLDTGWLLWVAEGRLVAQRLDVAQAALTGEPVMLADAPATDALSNISAISVASTGLVAYRAGTASQRQLTWVDRLATVRGTVGDSDATYSSPRVSPDGQRVAVGRTVQGNFDLWLLDGARLSRLTFDAARDQYPEWSPDGTRVAFRSTRSGVGDIFLKLVSGEGAEERLAAEGTPSGWSPDGRFLLFLTASLETSVDISVVPVVGVHLPSAWLKTRFRETSAVFSPDGKWVAYHSDESGRPEIYVRPFDLPGGAGGQWQVSAAGGIYPAWRPDGKELYYLSPVGAMMAAPITVTGAAVVPGAAVVLFPTRIVGGGVDTQQGRQYDVAPDGRFLINTVLDSAAAPITLLQNWNPEAKK